VITEQYTLIGHEGNESILGELKTGFLNKNAFRKEGAISTFSSAEMEDNSFQKQSLRFRSQGL
jgi:hypothetical protein